MIIYKVTNTINSKVYIGQTTETLERRWTRHKYNSKSDQRYFYKAIRKHGAENFRIETLCSCRTKADLDYCERYFIAAFASSSPKNGYNLTHGGEGGQFTEERKKDWGHWARGVKRSAETRQKISDALKGRKGQEHSEEQYAHWTNEIKPQFTFAGRQHKDTSKAKISQRLKGRKVESLRVPIELTHKVSGKKFHFESINEAADSLNLNRRSISNVLNGWAESLRDYEVVRLEK